MNRREFMRTTGTVGAAMSLPYSGLAMGADEMMSRRIPGTDERLPVVGFGHSQSFREGDYANSRKLLDVLLEMGGSFVDIGGRSQAMLGRYMRDHNASDRLFLGTNVRPSNASDSLAAIGRAREMQGKETLDLLQLANPTDVDTQWQLMLRAKEQGHARYVGIAIARRVHYEMLESIIRSETADFVQLNYSMLEPESGERLLPLARDKGIAVVANRPFVNGRYFGLVKDKPLPGWAAEFDCHSWAQFSLKFILANPAVVCVITETSKTKHAIDNLTAGFGRLPDEKTRLRMLKHVQSF